MMVLVKTSFRALPPAVAGRPCDRATCSDRHQTIAVDSRTFADAPCPSKIGNVRRDKLPLSALTAHLPYLSHEPACVLPSSHAPTAERTTWYGPHQPTARRCHGISPSPRDGTAGIATPAAASTADRSNVRRSFLVGSSSFYLGNCWVTGTAYMPRYSPESRGQWPGCFFKRTWRSFPGHESLKLATICLGINACEWPLLSTCQVKWTGLPWHVHQPSSNVSVKKETGSNATWQRVQRSSSA
jgi:hypothetical protein